MEEKKFLTQEEFMKVLDACYEKAVDGIFNASKDVPDIACEYLDRYKEKDVAAKKMLNMQVTKCATAGFIAGFGGLITLPITVPANLTSVLYVQLRMIATTAFIGGYDVKSDEVRTLAYACLAGISLAELVKQFGIKFGEKMTTAMIKKIPGTVLTKINQKVGMRFITKFGEKGLINLGKMVPVVGALVSGGFDLAETKVIANRAYKWFIVGDIEDGQGTEIDIIQDTEES